MSNVENTEAKKTRQKAVKNVLLEILDENGQPMKISADRVKVLCEFTKMSDELFDLINQHPNYIRLKF